MTRQYTASEKAQAVALLPIKTDKEIAAQTGIPRRTLSYWRAQWREAPATGVVAIVEHNMAEIVGQGALEAVTRLRASINDPKARLGEVAKAAEVLLRADALYQGRATENVAINSNGAMQSDNPFGLTDEEARDLMNVLDEEIRSRSEGSIEDVG